MEMEELLKLIPSQQNSWKIVKKELRKKQITEVVSSYVKLGATPF